MKGQRSLVVPGFCVIEASHGISDKFPVFWQLLEMFQIILLAFQSNTRRINCWENLFYCIVENWVGK
jgi:hypothetical protein